MARTVFRPVNSIDRTDHYPPVLLETPCGVISWDHGDLPDVRFVAIEGHKRLRYHAAVRHAGRKARNHQVFILTSDVTDPLATT